jgi:hypothetical protein
MFSVHTCWRHARRRCAACGLRGGGVDKCTIFVSARGGDWADGDDDDDAKSRRFVVVVAVAAAMPATPWRERDADDAA